MVNGETNRIIEQTRRIRSAILQRHGFNSEQDVPASDENNALAEAAALASITAHWGISSNLPVVGRPIVLAKRLVRIGLRWYINPIVEQQNAFNDSVVTALYALQSENDRLWSELRGRSNDGSAP